MKPAICALFAFAVMFGACVFVAGTTDLMSLSSLARMWIAFFSITSAVFVYIHAELL